MEVESGTQAFYDAIAKAYRAEGPLVYYDGGYGGRLRPRRVLYDLLNEKTGVEVVDWFTCGQEQMVTKAANEAHSGELQFDVMQAQDFAIWEQLADGKHLMSYVPPESATLVEGTSSPDGYFTHISGCTNVPMYNPNRLKADELPKSWKDFLDPRWKGRLCFLDLNQRVPMPRLFAWLYAMYGPEYITSLAAQQPKQAKIGDLLIELLQNGEADLVMQVGAPRFVEAKKKGKAISYFIPDEGVWYTRSYVGINARTTKPNLSRLFVRFLLSRAAQQVLVESDFESSRTDIPATPDGYPPIAVLEREGKFIGDSSPFWLDAQKRYRQIALETYLDALASLNDKRTLNFLRLVDRVPGELPGDGYYNTEALTPTTHSSR